MTSPGTEGRGGLPPAREIDHRGVDAPAYGRAGSRPLDFRAAAIPRRAKERPTVNGGRAFLRRSIRDWMFGAFRGGALAPSNLLGAISRLVASPGEVLRCAMPGPFSRTAWTEFRNKLAAFRLFAEADRIAGMGTAGTYKLSDFGPAVEALGPFPGLWVTEGVGYYHAANALEANPAAREILSPAAVQGVPSRWLIPLHTGIGLALAGDHLRNGGKRGQWCNPRRAVESFLVRCRENTLEGYTGACAEALGLMALNVRLELVGVIDRELSVLSGDLADRFWHGYGRALYFSPANFLPCTGLVWPSIQRAGREPPHASGRANALAGLAWALTLVNMRDPEVIATFLAREGPNIPEPDAFASGVRSAVAVWVDWDPGSDYLSSFCAYEPSGASGGLGDHWARAARGACNDEFTREYHWLKAQNRLDDLFRYFTASPHRSRGS
jgi:hypothetical protein